MPDVPVEAVGNSVYIPLSIVMFLEYAIWGAWAPVLAARLLGPLKMTGKQTGWIYATLPLAFIIAPLVAGQMADGLFATKWILGVAHLIGAALLFVAATQRSFKPLFAAMLCYSFCYAATVPLVNSILFDQISDGDTRNNVFIWAPIAWALVGYGLTAWRWKFKTEGEGRDCLILAGILSVVMSVCCFAIVPTNELANTGKIPIVEAFSELQNTSFLIFMIISMVVVGLMQFYFLGTAQFMQDAGIPGKNVPASMAIAQACQAIATLFLLGIVLTSVGNKWTLTIGAGCWLAMYAIYVAGKPRALIIASQSLHGLAYMFFVIGGVIFTDSVARPEIRSSMQALLSAATMGVGLFFGTQFAGIVMDRFSVDGKFQWRGVWMVPAAIMLAGVLALVLVFTDAPPAENDSPEKPATAARDVAPLLKTLGTERS